VGGMISATILTLIVIPAIYALVKEFTVRSIAAATAGAAPAR
jgi:Cu(I)/Ag(I) efflux system membrane protein CusA/SilA